jgi:hypothetical protein
MEPAGADEMRSCVEALANGTDESHRASGRRRLVQAVCGEKLSVQDLVQLLGGLLTSTEEKKRADGMGLLAEVLAVAPAEALPQASCHHLVAFCCDRLKDVSCLTETLSGLLALLRHRDVSPEGAVLAAQAMIAELSVQSLSQAARQLVYETFGQLLGRYLAAIRTIGTQFATGVVAAIDGEKDPRNLILTFRIVPTLVESLEAARGELAEELFDVISCYFPITFEAPPGDKFGVSGDDLRQALAEAFSCTSHFADFCIPLLVDKLSSSVCATKLQCLRYLQRCTVSYGAISMQKHMPSLWRLIVEDSAHVDEQVAKSSSETAATVVRVYTSAVGEWSERIVPTGRTWHPHIVKAVGGGIVKRCTSVAHTVPCSHHQVRCVCRLTRALVDTSAELLHDVATTLLPQLLHEKAPSDLFPYVSLLAELLGAAETCSLTQPFLEHKDAILEMATGVMNSPVATAELRSVAIRSLGSLICISDDESCISDTTARMLTASEVADVLQCLSVVLMDQCGTSMTAETVADGVCTRTLISISETQARSVAKHCIAPVHLQLQCELSTRATIIERINTTLAVLVVLAQRSAIHFVWIVPKLTTDLHSLLSAIPATSSQGSTHRTILACTLLSWIAAAFNNLNSEVIECASACTSQLYDIIATYIEGGPTNASADDAPGVVHAAEQALRKMIRVIPQVAQASILSTVVEKLFVLVAVGADSASQSARALLLQTAAGLITGMSRDSVVPRVAAVVDLLRDVVLWQRVTIGECRAAGQCLGSIFNKRNPNDPTLDSAQQAAMEFLSRKCTGEVCRNELPCHMTSQV